MNTQSALKEMINFKGTATRSEYWIFLAKAFFFQTLIIVVGISAAMAMVEILPTMAAILLVATIATAIYTVIAMTSNAAGRARDAGWNAWWAVSLWVPYIGYVGLIVLGCLPTATE